VALVVSLEESPFGQPSSLHIRYEKRSVRLPVRDNLPSDCGTV
jgi:hypothetical protein